MKDDLARAVTRENCTSVPGPFYHGTRVELAIGSLLPPLQAPVVAATSTSWNRSVRLRTIRT